VSRQVGVRAQTGVLPVFSVEDVRQFVYCPRIVYFRYVLRSIPRQTVKMRRGSQDHEKWRQRRIRRGEVSDRYFGLFFQCDDIGLCGLLDAVDYDGHIARPIELKTGKHPQGRLSEHHRAQVIAQCVLLERCLNLHVDGGVVVYSATGEEMFVSLTDESRIWLERTLEKMRKIVQEEVPPSVTTSSKCVDCEYWQWCMRV